MSRHIVLAFDLFGTILDTSSWTKNIAEFIEPLYPKKPRINIPAKASSIAADIRRYQIEYTWRLNSMGSYLPFDTCTKLAIKHAFALEGLRLQDEDYDELTNWFASYNTKFEDAEVFLRYVAPGLTKTLQDRGNKGHILSILVFTNGDPGMIGQAVDDSAYMEEVFGPSDGPSRELGADNVRVLPPCSVHGVKAYKPHPAAYNYLRCKWIPEHSVAKSEVPAEVFLVSSNEWDVAGAESAGLGTIWVDRARKGRMDALGMELRSGSGGFVINGLQEVGRVVEKILSGEKPNVDAMSDI